MDKLDISLYKRNTDVIKSYFKLSDNKTFVAEDIRILFPERYINRDLADIGSYVKVIAIYAVIDSLGNYGVVSAPIMNELSPSNVYDVMIGTEVYKCLEFKKGSMFLTNNTLIMNDNFIYNLFDEFIVKGKIPWYISYEDISNLLLETQQYSGSSIGKNPITMEILTSIIARDPDNKNEFFRQTVNKPGNKIKDPVYVGLNNIYYSFNTTGAKLIGGYFGSGVTTAVVDNEKETSKLAEILRA